MDDLLAREPVRLDLPEVRSLIADRTVLVTGAAGSIGSELCRQLAAHGAARLVLFDRYENGMFQLEGELRDALPRGRSRAGSGRRAARGSARRRRSHTTGRRSCSMPRPTSTCRSRSGTRSRQSRNNVLGTCNAARAADRPTASRSSCWCRPTRRCSPASVMGVSKRAAEMVVHEPADRSAAGSWSCASGTCSAPTAAWCRSSASRSRAAGRSR